MTRPSNPPQSPEEAAQGPVRLPSLQPTLQFSAEQLRVEQLREGEAPPRLVDTSSIEGPLPDADARDGAPSAPAPPRTVVLSPEDLAQFRAPSSGRGAATVLLPSGAPSGSRPPPFESAPPVALPHGGPLAGTAPPRAPNQAWRIALFGAGALAVLVLVVFGGSRLLLANSRSWIAPTVLSKSDPRVLQVATTLERETARRSELALRQKQTLARLEELDRSLALEASFRSSFEAALRSDLLAQRAEVRRLQRLADERDAAASAASGAERAELDAMLSSARRRIRLLQAAAAGGRTTSYDALALRREYDLSRVKADVAATEKAALMSALVEINEAVHQNASLLAMIESSPYRLAITHDAMLGFVPYDNLGSVREDQDLLSCRVGIFFCERIGTLDALLPGEVRGTNPINGSEARGQLATLSLATPEAATEPLLFLK